MFSLYKPHQTPCLINKQAITRLFFSALNGFIVSSIGYKSQTSLKSLQGDFQAALKPLKTNTEINRLINRVKSNLHLLMYLAYTQKNREKII